MTIKLKPEIDKSKDIIITAKEFEVVKCIARGMTNAEIAARLNCSIRTVQAHITNIIRKLKKEYGVKNRTQIVTTLVSERFLKVKQFSSKSEDENEK